jgi:hypothetical protein
MVVSVGSEWEWREEVRGGREPLQGVGVGFYRGGKGETGGRGRAGDAITAINGAAMVEREWGEKKGRGRDRFRREDEWPWQFPVRGWARTRGGSVRSSARGWGRGRTGWAPPVSEREGRENEGEAGWAAVGRIRSTELRFRVLLFFLSFARLSIKI